MDMEWLMALLASVLSHFVVQRIGGITLELAAQGSIGHASSVER